jgi:hypothetical protein
MVRLMRSDHRANAAFLEGVAAGLALAGVTVLTVEAARRIRERQGPTELADFIDGVHPPNEAELDARPAEEANAVEFRLVSEAPDFSARSQRW